MQYDSDLALQPQHCWLAGDILDVERRVARDKLILKWSNKIFSSCFLFIQVHLCWVCSKQSLLTQPLLGLALVFNQAWVHWVLPSLSIKRLKISSMFSIWQKLWRFSTVTVWEVKQHTWWTSSTFGAGREKRFPLDVNCRLVLMWTCQDFVFEKTIKKMWTSHIFPEKKI